MIAEFVQEQASKLNSSVELLCNQPVVLAMVSEKPFKPAILVLEQEHNTNKLKKLSLFLKELIQV